MNELRYDEISKIQKKICSLDKIIREQNDNIYSKFDDLRKSISPCQTDEEFSRRMNDIRISMEKRDKNERERYELYKKIHEIKK